MPYNPRPSAATTLEELRSWVEEECRAISREMSETVAVDLRPINAAPVRPRDGMIIYADGVNFNPGAGAGIYAREAGTWIKL